MKRNRLFQLFFLIVVSPHFIDPIIDCQSVVLRCTQCKERRAKRKKTAALVFSAIAQIAGGIALIVGNHNGKDSYNEGISTIVAAIQILASQISKRDSSNAKRSHLSYSVDQFESIIVLLKIVQQQHSGEKRVDG